MMVELNIDDSLVVIIDFQEKLVNAVFNKQICVQKAEILVKAANILNVPILVTEQYPRGLGETIESLKSILEHAQYYEKTSFSALASSEILDAVRQQKRKQIILLGIETHICVSQTASSLIKLGYDVQVIEDACGSRNELEYLAGLERMKDNGAHLLTTEIALFELLKTSTHPKFKEIQNLIK